MNNSKKQKDSGKLSPEELSKVSGGTLREDLSKFAQEYNKATSKVGEGVEKVKGWAEDKFKNIVHYFS